MKTSFDLDTILYGILNASPLKAAISGGIYKEGDRPEDSHLEDVEITTRSTPMDHYPQHTVSNVNIYVPDTEKNVGGKWVKKSNTKRLDTLSKLAVTALKQANVAGCALTVENQTKLSEPAVEQHFVNIRVFWNIQD